MSGPGPCDSPLRSAAARFADRTALVSGERRWTFRAFDRTVDRLAGGLRSALPVGARVALFMRNRPEFLLLQCAIERAGLVRVPLNARYTAVEVGDLIDDCDAAALFHDDDTAAVAGSALGRTAARPWRCNVQAGSDADGGAGWSALLAAAPIDGDLGAADLDALCSINYTSGTSNRPKGVMLSHRHWRCVTRNMLIDRRIVRDDVLAHVGPLTHASGTYFAPFFLRGATSVIVESASVADLPETIERERVTGFTCVPTVLTRLLALPALDRHDLSSLAWIGYGAEPIPQNTLEAAWRRFGPILTGNYGLTEAMMTVAFLPPELHTSPHDGRLRAGYIGRPYSFVDLVLRAPNGRPVPDGEVGEITIRAEHVMAGYWRRPEATAEVLRDGWLWTGDLAVRDADGLFRLTGRSKDMIISGGFNIYPLEVERCINAHPDVAECAVIGRADVEFGEIAVAYVAAARSDITADQLAAHCKPLIGIRTPKRWTFVESLPKNANGKVDKAALRREGAVP